MKNLSSLPYNKGRFFLLFLLLGSFHLMQAVCRPEKAYTQTEVNRQVKIVISEEATVSGLEHIHIISRTEVKKNQNQFKNIRKPATAKKLSKKTGNKLSGKRQDPKSPYRFSNSAKSDTSLSGSGIRQAFAFGGSSFSFKCIITDHVKTMGVLILLPGIFLISLYKSRVFSGCYDLQNFQRPPPVSC